MSGGLERDNKPLLMSNAQVDCRVDNLPCGQSSHRGNYLVRLLAVRRIDNISGHLESMFVVLCYRVSSNYKHSIYALPMCGRENLLKF